MRQPDRHGSKIVLKTEEISTIEFVRKLAGELPRGWEPNPAFFATQGARELAFPDVTPAAPRVRWWQALLPTLPRLPTHAMKDAASFDPRFLLGGQQSLASQQAAAWRQEDKAEQTVINGLTWRPKIESDELLLGNGFAFAIIQRAGGDRADIIDLAAAA